MRFVTYLLILSVLFLTGCETLCKKPEPEIVYKTKTVVVAPPKELVIPCKKEPPPDKKTYLQANADGREQILIDLTVRLYTEIDKCNAGITAYEAWLERQLKLYQKQE